jgi:hypothetical protein
MKRYSISYWVSENNSTNETEVIASDFVKAIGWCEKHLTKFKLENIKYVYVYTDVNIAE